MFEIELHDIEKELGADAGLKLKYKALDLIRPALCEFGGQELEDILWIFDKPINAVKGALKMKQVLEKYNFG